jgi:DeoR/GlpR family transcriptional regulator of sugar metabolism
MNNSFEWRQSEISRILQTSQPTINRDMAYLRQQAKYNIKKYIDERLPENGRRIGSVNSKN